MDADTGTKLRVERKKLIRYRQIFSFKFLLLPGKIRIYVIQSHHLIVDSHGKERDEDRGSDCDRKIGPELHTADRRCLELSCNDNGRYGNAHDLILDVVEGLVNLVGVFADGFLRLAFDFLVGELRGEELVTILHFRNELAQVGEEELEAFRFGPISAELYDVGAQDGRLLILVDLAEDEFFEFAARSVELGCFSRSLCRCVGRQRSQVKTISDEGRAGHNWRSNSEVYGISRI